MLRAYIEQRTIKRLAKIMPPELNEGFDAYINRILDKIHPHS